MARALDLVRVMAVSDAIYPCWFADVCYSCDARWWRHHQGLPGFPGIRIGLEDVKQHAGVGILRNSGTQGFDPDPGALRSGGNSGYQALHLAAHFGISKAILVGYDLKGDRWFGNHPSKIASVDQALRFPDRIAEFADLGRELAKIGIVVKRASMNSALTTFPLCDLAREMGIEGRL